MRRVGLLLAAACLSSPPCFATLGEAGATVDQDGAHLRARVQRTVTGRYSVHTLSTPQGVQVREYSAPGGVVFAVCWDGPFLPDLQQLLGVHYVTLKMEAARAPHAGHSQLAIVRPEVVIHSAGHMRSFHGSAFVPSAVPVGVTIAEIR